jgi:hypothetical protein
MKPYRAVASLLAVALPSWRASGAAGGTIAKTGDFKLRALEPDATLESSNAGGGDMTRRMLRAAAVVALAAAVATGTAGAVTPANGGDAGGTTTTINNGPGDQTDPHVSGDLAVYTDNTGATSTIHYFDFRTGSDHVVPNAGDYDLLSDVNGGRIVFSRLRPDGRVAVVLFDTVSGSVANRGANRLARRSRTEQA